LRIYCGSQGSTYDITHIRDGKGAAKRVPAYRVRGKGWVKSRVLCRGEVVDAPCSTAKGKGLLPGRVSAVNAHHSYGITFSNGAFSDNIKRELIEGRYFPKKFFSLLPLLPAQLSLPLSPPL